MLAEEINRINKKRDHLLKAIEDLEIYRKEAIENEAIRIATKIQKEEEERRRDLMKKTEIYKTLEAERKIWDEMNRAISEHKKQIKELKKQRVKICRNIDKYSMQYNDESYSLWALKVYMTRKAQT